MASCSCGSQGEQTHVPVSFSFHCAWRRRMFVTDYRCTPPPSLFPSSLCLAHLFYACIVCESVHVESLHSECEFHALPPGLCGFRKNWPSLCTSSSSQLLLHLLLGLISQLRPHPGQPLAHSDCSDSLVSAFSVVLSAAAEVNVTMLFRCCGEALVYFALLQNAA